jgi:hypothetical protein
MFSAFGLTPGETLRVSVAAPVPEDGFPARDGYILQIRLYDASGATIGSSGELPIAPGQIQFFDLNRDTLRQRGDEHGRIQVRTEVLLRRTISGVPIPDDGLPTSLEIIDNVSGKTTAIVLPVPEDGIPAIGSRRFSLAPVGLAAGETLRNQRHRASTRRWPASTRGWTHSPHTIIRPDGRAGCDIGRA